MRENVSYTLDTVDRHAVCAGFMAKQGEKAGTIGYVEEQAPTLSAMRHDASVICLNDQGGSVMAISKDISGTLRAQEHGHQLTILDMSHACDVIRDCGEIAPSLQARMGTGGNQVPLVAYCIGNGQVCQLGISEKAGALNCMHDQQAVFCPNVAHTLKSKGNCDFREDSETYIYAAVDCRNGTLQAKSNGGTSYNLNNVVREHRTVRRLTPLEYERLQGFPDGWTDIGEWTDTKGKVHDESSDSARYRALGNSIALPSWFYVMRKLSLCCEGDWTMASLFDGIGGFPLIWERLHGKGTCLWASEIEDFPIAVTKIHFAEEQDNES